MASRPAVAANDSESEKAEELTADEKSFFDVNQRLIPTCNDHNPLAHLRCPMVIMRQG
jgi:hypothetical protein